MLGFYMYQKGQQFYGGDGIITKGVENTITNIGRLGREGMRETDKEIIRKYPDLFDLDSDKASITYETLNNLEEDEILHIRETHVRGIFYSAIFLI